MTALIGNECQMHLIWVRFNAQSKYQFMIIEFYTSDGAIGESIINYARDGILKLHKEYKNISRADVSFRQKKRQSGIERICEISLFMAGNTITAKGICKGFDHACAKAVDALHQNLILNLKQKVHSL